MSSNETEIDKEIQAILSDRLETLERDAAESEEWTPDLKKRHIKQLKTLVPK